MQAPTLKMLDQLHARITRLEAQALGASAADFADRKQRRAKVVHTLPRRNAARLEDLSRTHSRDDKFREDAFYDSEQEDEIRDDKLRGDKLRDNKLRDDKLSDATCWDMERVEPEWEYDSDCYEIDEADVVWSARDDLGVDTPHKLTSTQLAFLEAFVKIYLRQVVGGRMPPQDLAYRRGMKDLVAGHFAAITAITRPGFPLNQFPVKAILKDLWPEVLHKWCPTANPSSIAYDIVDTLMYLYSREVEPNWKGRYYPWGD
jgi:hypothetical protein